MRRATTIPCAHKKILKTSAHHQPCCMNVIKEINRINKREISLNVTEEASWHAKYKDSAYIYVGGLPFDLNEGDVIQAFSQYVQYIQSPHHPILTLIPNTRYLYNVITSMLITQPHICFMDIIPLL